VKIGTVGFFSPFVHAVLSPVPINLRPFMAAWCMLSRGSPGSGCMVNRYACIATRASSSISGMILPISSIVKNDELKFCVRFSLSGRSIFLLLCFGSRCLSLLDCDVSLRSSHCVLFVVPLDSRLLLSLLLAIAISCAGAKRTGTPLTLLFLNPQVLSCHG
jgi:hypothetical protein